MERRSFLQFMAGFGVALGLPSGKLELDSPEKVEKAWEAVRSHPMVFELIKGSPTLYLAGILEPRTRADCLGFQEPLPTDPKELIGLGSGWREEAVMAQAYLDDTDSDEDTDDVSKETWEAWILADPENAAFARRSFEFWLQETDLNEFDYEAAARCGYTDQGAAVRFWTSSLKTLEPFGVVIIEGDHPGSSYVGAELSMDVSEANKLAIELGVPIRFVEKEW